MTVLLNRAAMTVNGTPGIGTVTLAAPYTGCQSFIDAGAISGNTYPYVIEDPAGGASAWEIGHGVITITGPTITLARTTVEASSIGGGKITASSSSIVYIAMTAADFNGLPTTLAALTDVNVTEGAGINAYALTWDNGTSKWIATQRRLDTLADVNVTEGAGIDGKFLKWDNGTSKWIAATASGGRTALVADTTFYVRTDGSDSNNGLANTAGGAWLTFQHAWDTICQNYDLAGFVAQIKAADGTYADAPILVNQPLGGWIRITGNTGNQTAVQLTGAWYLNNIGAGCQLEYVEFNGVATICFNTFGAGCNWFLQNVDFNACSGQHIFADGQSNISIYDKVTFAGSTYTITGNFSNHLSAVNQSQIYLYVPAITLVGTPVIAAQYAFADILGMINYTVSAGFIGTATGKRYQADNNAIINTYGSGATYLPGNVAGTTSAGGLYL